MITFTLILVDIYLLITLAVSGINYYNYYKKARAYKEYIDNTRNELYEQVAKIQSTEIPREKLN